jgi:hypothetical protein
MEKARARRAAGSWLLTLAERPDAPVSLARAFESEFWAVAKRSPF